MITGGVNLIVAFSTGGGATGSVSRMMFSSLTCSSMSLMSASSTVVSILPRLLPTEDLTLAISAGNSDTAAMKATTAKIPMTYLRDEVLRR